MYIHIYTYVHTYTYTYTREKQPINVDEAYASIQSAIDSYIITISNALKIPIHLFSPWKSFVT